MFDTFDYTPQQMTDLYNSAHAFILPSVGEGWGSDAGRGDGYGRSVHLDALVGAERLLR